MKTLFKILDFNVDSDINCLHVELDTDHKCHIPLDQFEKWLERTDRLAWTHDWSDHNGEHCQETGQYTIDQYWDMSAKFIKHDIYEFIVINFIDPIKGIKDSITKITSEYAKG